MTEKITNNLDQYVLDTLNHFGVEGSDLGYAASLYKQFITRDESKRQHVGLDGFIPSAFLSDLERTELLGAIDYKDIKGQEKYINTAAQTTVVIHQMDGGLGSSISRLTYLEKIWEKIHREGPVHMGAKSTDQFWPAYRSKDAPEGTLMSVMEIKLNRVIKEARQFKAVFLEPLLNHDSLASYKELLQLTVIDERKLGIWNGTTYSHLFNESSNITLLDPILQADLPAIDVATNSLTNERKAPGSHGQIGTALLERFSRGDVIQDQNFRVHAIYNGDGVNNSFSVEDAGFVAAEQAGIAMITVKRRSDDKKVGLIGVIEKNGMAVPDILELQAAKKVKQTTLFDAIGVRQTTETDSFGREHSIGEQYTNTNIVLANETLLNPFLHQIREYLGEQRFMEIITPELGENEKEQNGKLFTQLEGPLGSVILRLNAFVLTDPYASQVWEKISGGAKFLRFINLSEPQDRDDHFTPNKYALDNKYQQLHFVLDTDTWKIVNKKSGHAFHVSGTFVEDPYYKDVDHIEQTFGDADILDLDELSFERVSRDGEKAKGYIHFPNSILRGTVSITVGHEGCIDLTAPEIRKQLNQVNDGPLVLENIEICTDKEGNVTYKRIGTSDISSVGVIFIG